MLAFAHILALQRIKIGEVNSKLVDPAAALTVIGAEIETSRVLP